MRYGERWYRLDKLVVQNFRHHRSERIEQLKAATLVGPQRARALSTYRLYQLLRHSRMGKLEYKVINLWSKLLFDVFATFGRQRRTKVADHGNTLLYRRLRSLKFA